MNASSLVQTSSRSGPARSLLALACASVVACGGGSAHTGSPGTGGNVSPGPSTGTGGTDPGAGGGSTSGTTTGGGTTDGGTTTGGTTGGGTPTVTPPVIVAVTITPAVATLAAGTRLAYEAAAVLSDGSKQDVTASAAWAASPEGIATVTASGEVTGLGVGSATITASVGDVSASSQLSVTDAVLAAIEVSPADPTLPLGVSQPFAATGVFGDGTRQDLTAAVTWSSADPTVATVAPSGAATPVATGATRVVATLGTVSGSTSLTVTDATLVSIAVDPPSATFAAGTPAALTATATYSDSTTQDVTALATWSSSDPTIATVDAAGTLTGRAPGSATVVATFQGQTDASAVVVTPAVLASLAIAPGSTTIPKGLLQPLALTGTFSDGSTQDLTAAAAWTSSAPGVAAVSNAAGDEGQVTAVDVGSATVTASFGGLSAGASVTVSGATVASIAVTPATATLPVGYSQQLRAAATYSDGSTRDVTSEVTWSSSAPSVATVSNATGTQGLATGVAASASAVTVSASMTTPSGAPVVGSATVEVASLSLQSIAVSPASFTVARRATTRLVAVGTFSGGVTLDVTRNCAWSSSNRSVATVARSGVVTGVAAGTATIKAKKGNRQGTSSGTVQ